MIKLTVTLLSVCILTACASKPQSTRTLKPNYETKDFKVWIVPKYSRSLENQGSDEKGQYKTISLKVDTVGLEGVTLLATEGADR